VTRADVLRVAKQYFHPEELATVAVGNTKELGKPLSTLGKVTALDLTIPEPKAAAAAPAGDATLGQGRQLLERAQQAMGGADKLAAIKDFRATRQLNMAAGGLTIKQVNLFLAPTYLRQEQELPFGKMTAFSDGKSGWLAAPPQGVLPMPAEILKQAQGVIFRDLTGLMLSTRDASRKVNAVGENTVEIANADGQSVKVEFDPATGLPLKETYAAAGMAGATVVETMSDWRDAGGGVKVPFKTVLEQNGQKVAEGTASEFKFNVGLTPEELGKRP
jgi:hypothetical protein